MKLELQRRLLDRASAHIDAETTDMADHALRVHAAHYTSKEQLAREEQSLFRERPLLVALTPDLPEPGSFVAQEIAGTSVLLVRGEDGVARAFVNACRHRGVRIAEGRGSRKRFACPFHAWTYDLEGRVRSRPLACGGFEGLGENFDRLQEIPSHEVAGMIYVQLDGGDVVSGVRALLGNAIDEIGDYRIDDHLFFGARKAERACNYKFVVDGFCETYHLKVLHRDTIAKWFFNAGLMDALGPVTRLIGVRTTIEEELSKPREEQRFPRHGTTQYIIPPNVVLVYQVDHVQCWQAYPVAGDPGRCVAELRIYWPKPMDEVGREKAEFNLDLLWNVVTTEDLPQSVSTHANLASGALPELVFGRNEPALVHYHEQIEAATGGDTITAIGTKS